MKTLLAWDDPKEAELLLLYLTLGEDEARSCATADELFAAAGEGHWDVVLLAQHFPSTAEEGLATFLRLRALLPELPVVLGLRADAMRSLPRYLTKGLRSYLIRDEAADFIFLVQSALESTVAAVRAENARILSERLREEMDSVRKLQETIIPRRLGTQAGYRTAARYEPSEVAVGEGQAVVLAGGDYYDVFPVDGSTLVLLVGDASGHGLKACMSIITMHTLIHMVNTERYRDTAQFVADINRLMCDNAIVQSGGGFITLFYGVIDSRRHTLTWSSAGHPLALLHDLEADEVRLVGVNTDSGLPLAISAEAEYEAKTVPLPPRSRVLVYSDGLTDALAPGGGTTMFGLPGIMRALRSARSDELPQALERLFAESKAFTGGHGRHDDTSVVLVERYDAS
jgi:serine phosphatase RsbU (regulator of sigma subunit)